MHSYCLASRYHKHSFLLIAVLQHWHAIRSVTPLLCLKRLLPPTMSMKLMLKLQRKLGLHLLLIWLSYSCTDLGEKDKKGLIYCIHGHCCWCSVMCEACNRCWNRQRSPQIGQVRERRPLLTRSPGSLTIWWGWWQKALAGHYAYVPEWL